MLIHTCKYIHIYRFTYFTGVVDEIDHKIMSILNRRSTLILRRWIDIDRQYRLYSPVGDSASTVNIDRDRSTGSIDRWIGVDICIGVGIIYHQTWDRDFLVDVCPGPFHTTYGTIGQCSFFPTSRENAVNRFFLVWIHIDGRFRQIFWWNRRSMRYRPSFQIGESASTVDIDRDKSTGRLKSNRPIDDTCDIFTYICTYLYTCICTHIHIYVFEYMHLHTRIIYSPMSNYICTYKYTYVNIYIYLYMYIHTEIYIHIK